LPQAGSLSICGRSKVKRTCLQARVTKHQAKKIALARVKRGAIKCVELEKENGVLIWSVDIAQPPKRDLTDVWVDPTTGKITAVQVETPITEKKEVA
jgi:uncharacterized membrane protein YkoI